MRRSASRTTRSCLRSDHDPRALRLVRTTCIGRRVLTGRSRAIALARGGSRVLLSLTHDGDYSMAHALLVGDLPDAGVGRT